MKSPLSTFCFLLVSFALLSQKNLISPEQYFRHYGKQHSLHYQIVEYIKYADQQSDQLQLTQYGESAQGRPMYLAYISSAENLKSLENIRLTNLYNTGVLTQKPTQTIEKALVWCSFGVHGNEAGTTESAINIIYQLLTNPNAGTWLKNTVVIIDPSLNPDGYDRYVHFLKNASGANIHPDAMDREHMEPWPSGRYNHYMYDLNRDWAWHTQQETKARIAVYNQWLPHVHADFHEMGYNSNYFFAPAAEPMHQYVTPFQREFQLEIGKNHASYFDKNGWLYWTRERFDLLYPSYGDTYPSYSGAIGMTYEQAGNSSSGRAILLSNGDTLTIQDKIDHNTQVGLSTVEVASKNADKLISNFKTYYKQSAQSPVGKYKGYVLKRNPSISRLAEIFDNSGIKYGYASKNSTATAYHYQSKAIKSFEISSGDMVISANQPRSVLLQVLMEEEPMLTDSITYDITAWSLPFAYGLDCYAFSSTPKIDVAASYEIVKPEVKKNGNPVFAYQIPWNDLHSAKILAQLHKHGVKVRMTVTESFFQGKKIEKGTLVVSRGDNKWMSDFESKIEKLAEEYKIYDYVRHYSGFSDKGGDLGGGNYQLIFPPKVLSFAGRGISSNSCGEIWHYFDKTLNYPVSTVEWDRFDRINLSDFNTIILPDGSYSISEDRYKKLDEWTRSGGRLIVIEGAVQQFSGKKGLNFETFATEDDKKAAESQDRKLDLEARLNDFEGQERRNISKGTAGAIVKNKVDDSHPLAYGLGKTYYSLKTSSSTFALQKGLWNVIHVPKGYDSYGFIGSGMKKRVEESVSFAVQSNGSGQAVFMVDNPLFRGFWDKGLLLFANAVFLNGYIPQNY
jgi:hypothetical protein